MKIRTAPLTAVEVEALNRLQQNPLAFVFTPYDCHQCGSVLTATENGMACPKCGHAHQNVSQHALDIALAGPRQLTIWNP